MAKKPVFTLSPHQRLVTQEFRQALLNWDQNANKREMPWKGIKDPYKIWLSEIILQQTRVEQGQAYYEKFIQHFPHVQDLAAAPEEKVFRLWEGLGYYSRCRNLIASARAIAARNSFPDTYEEILQLKGVGAYTAAAIASFAYNLPHAVLDGNVYRVISRILRIEEATDTTAARQYFSWLAQELMDPGQPARYNQAIMDFGATVCKPAPACASCFFNDRCLARLAGLQDQLPLKSKKLIIGKRFLNYIILTSQEKILIRPRITKDIWKGLHEFFLIESQQPVDIRELESRFRQETGLGIKAWEAGRIQQKLTHRDVHLHFVKSTLPEPVEIPGYAWVSTDALDEYAFPRSLRMIEAVTNA